MTEKANLDNMTTAYEKSYAKKCECALRITEARITNLKQLLECEGEAPFDHVESRIKTLESALEKCERKGCDIQKIDINTIRETVRDVAGVRIITKFCDEITDVVKLIKKLPGINIVNEKDYVSQPKENGYRSYHMDALVEIYTPEGSELIPVEIQIRNQSMNLWATLEHELKYKNSNPSPEVTEKFSKIAEILQQFDEEAIALRDFQAPTKSWPTGEEIVEPDDAHSSETSL